MALLVTHLFDRAETGMELTELPLHLPLTPWFRHDNRGQVVRAVKRATAGIEPITILPDVATRVWDGKKSRLGHLVIPQLHLLRLHDQLMGGLREAEADFDPAREQEPYRPYIAIAALNQLTPSFTAVLDSVHVLTEAERGGYRVLGNAPLEG